MKPLLAPRVAARLVALFIVLLGPTVARADYINVAQHYAAGLTGLSDAGPAVTDADDADDEEPAPRPEEMAALLLWMIIGDVPVVPSAGAKGRYRP